MRSSLSPAFGLCFLALLTVDRLHATDYDVGPGKALETISEVPWESLDPGDTVRIHWRETPYREKWVIARQGTEAAPITVSGVPNAEGELPVVSGRDATTRSTLNFWNEERGVIKIGGSNVPADVVPSYIVVENLDIRSGRPPYTFTGRNGVASYRSNAAAIYLEKGSHITIRNCILQDSGNGLFTASASSDVLVERCYLFDNGIEGSIFEHNNYSESEGIIFQFNRFGPLREECGGNNLKDRSTGLVIRYNWIEGGNRQLDLVDTDHFMGHPDYGNTYVYGNILVEFDGEGNSQMVHYGGDSGDESRYRQGTLYFHHNTVVSTRTGNTTLIRLSSSGETADVRNNVLYTTAEGNRLAILNTGGEVQLRGNWIKAGWRTSHDAPAGNVLDAGGNITGQEPGFVDAGGGDYALVESSPCVDAGGVLAEAALGYEPMHRYVSHQSSASRTTENSPDIGAYEFTTTRSDFNGDGRVDFDDFLTFAAAFGRTSTDSTWNPAFDLDGDLRVGFGDFLEFAASFGRSFAFNPGCVADSGCTNV